ncbi:thymidylate synthase family protein [Saccharicrinis fermentans]|uniref:Thymidylate synthase n=1 Tax=Saccharicrinis fermentans DSM 9555 = JCM 21142 TaxID=869213 RepID=W7YBZ1_9BACT|nr:hypothetical protein [Saccharicrinis fermentans]GAF05972.1 thymidylate synthase [Saccharicrinis fermentans DSM 9555 = JCM 21142]
MAHLIISENELEAYYKLILKIRECGVKSSRYLELLNCLVSINHSEDGFNDFIQFKNEFINTVGNTAKLSFKRADRVYQPGIDLMTKPNYFNRMNSIEELFKDEIIKIDQISNVIFELADKPKHSLLTFTIFRPSDLIAKKRPGFVPCPIAGDFKFRNNELQLNMFFRTNDALNFFYPDVYYLRQLQHYVLDQAKKITRHKKLQNGSIGSLNLHFSRIFLPLRMEMRKREYINGTEIESIISALIDKLQLKQN